MSTSVGQIGLDLVLNSKDFKTQMKGIQSLAKKAGATLASAFAVKEIVQFTSECLALGSDLSEVQNVVDTAFPSMTKEMDAWAKSAATSFGLSETMAKRYAGTFGAMSKAFGFTEKEAYDMSTTLTGLAGDVASFYNISQDEAYTKLKSVFTGETESLKDLGVVMTQSALDSYAMANGFNKTTSAMDEQEKVALRYSFVLDKLGMATGDFEKTQDSWANQIRILKLQIDSLKATLGQGLINLFTPIVKVINTVLVKLATLANAFRAFTELITGKKSDTGASSFGQTESAAERSAEAATGAADSIDKATAAAKKNKSVTMGLDELNIVSDTSDTSGGSGTGSSGGSAIGESVDYGNLAEGETVIDRINKSTSALVDRLLELKTIFSTGWQLGLGDLSVLDSIKVQAGNIKTQLIDIFTDEGIITAANGMVDKIVLALGSTAGSVASIGLTIADNLTGGISTYLTQNNDFIKRKIVSLFDVAGDIALKKGELITAVADIFTVFRTPEAKQLTADIIAIFSDAFLGVLDISLKFQRDIFNFFADPIISNTDKLKTALDMIVLFVSQCTSTLRELVVDTADKMSSVYDTKIAPAFEMITSGVTDVFSVILDASTQYLAPVLDKISAGFERMKDNAIQPVIDKFIDLAGNIALCIGSIWAVIEPFVAWIAGQLVEELSSSLERIWNAFDIVVTYVCAAIGTVLDLLNGVIMFITGVFSGNWSMAWEGIKTAFSAQWEGIKMVFTPFADWLEQKVITPVTTMVGKIKTTLGTVASWIKTNVLAPIKTAFSTFWEGIKKVCNSILSGIETMVNGIVKGINRTIKALNSLDFDIPDWVPGLGGKSFGLSLPSISEVALPRLAEGGYVKKNTPQLAMIGDNKHQGEVVAPEGKLLEMARLAAESNSGNLAAVIAAIERLKEAILEGQDVPVEVLVDVDGDIIYKAVQKASRKRGVDFKMGAFER